MIAQAECPWIPGRVRVRVGTPSRHGIQVAMAAGAGSTASHTGSLRLTESDFLNPPRALRVPRPPVLPPRPPR